MARLLIPILIVTLAPAVVIPLGLSKGFQFRQLINYRRVLDGTGRVRFLALINRRGLQKLVACSKDEAVLTWSKLLRSIDRFKSFKLVCPAKLKELLSRFRFPRLVSRPTFSELTGHFNHLTRTTWSKLRNLIDHTQLTGLISCEKISSLVNRIQLSLLDVVHPGQSMAGSTQPDLTVLNCRAHLTKLQQDDSIRDVFAIEMCGSIRAPSDMHYTTLRVSIEDVTDGPGKAKPVQARAKQWRMQDSGEFCYSADLGKLPNQVTTLSAWTTVARLDPDWLIFPCKGIRDLRFTASVLSQQTEEELGTAQYTLSYENPTLGYIDLRENAQLTRTLAVALALAVSAADHRLYDCEVELIKNWAKSNIGPCRSVPGGAHPPESPKLPRASGRAKRRLDKAFERAVCFFRDGNQLDTYKICKEIVEIAPLADRYDILDLCLNVAKANGSVVEQELAVLKNLATWLEVDTDRFRAMMERTLPVSMHQTKDAEFILGVTSDMSEKETLQRLNKEYCKWNSRVTSSDPQVQAQADEMLKLIAEARAEYIA
jgi:hypothetical protein